MPTVGVGLGGLCQLLAPRAERKNRNRFAGFSGRLFERILLLSRNPELVDKDVAFRK
jgi:hypothetical protein